ncbi:MAG: hypothetical protein HRT95_08990 [Moritella sp.]|uniref:hypothetical protein n=1 Tax=Moritella sp. TaxID=78556 RepID=UPI001D690B62|nr:hypothetical protein [Moritella sp.]NQZ50303.1 hypothetical protein [Moritella sp.]
MGFWSSVCSAVSSVCSSVCSVASSAVSMVKEIGSMAVEGLRGVASVICNIAQSLGFMEKNENPIDLGDKIIQAEDSGITLASCDGDYEKYMTEIRNFKVDDEKSKLTADKDKLTACSVVMGARIENHYGVSIAPLIPLMGRNPDFFNGGRLKAMLDKGLSILKIGDYFSSNLERKDAAPVEATLVQNEKTLSPSSSDAELKDMLRSMRE